MTKYNKRVPPKGWMYPLNKKDIKLLIEETGASFERVEFGNTRNSNEFGDNISCWFGVISSKRTDGEYTFKLTIDSLKEQYVKPWKESVIKLIGNELKEWVKSKIDQPINSTEKPTQFFLSYDIDKDSISSNCFPVD